MVPKKTPAQQIARRHKVTDISAKQPVKRKVSLVQPASQSNASSTSKDLSPKQSQKNSKTPNAVVVQAAKPSPRKTITAKQAKSLPQDISDMSVEEADKTLFVGGHRSWYVPGFLAALGLLLVSAFFAHRQTVLPPEIHIFRHINDWPDKLRMPFKMMSIARNSTIVAVVAVLLVFSFKKWRLAWHLSVAILTAYVIGFGIKHFMHRPRPAQLFTDVHVRWSDASSAFPSGHTMVVTVILLTILPYLPRGWRWLVVTTGIAAVGLSRMYLGLHLPFDIVGGFAVGLLVVCGLRILPKKWLMTWYLD